MNGRIAPIELPPVGDRVVADRLLNAMLDAVRALAARDGSCPPVETIYASLNVIALACAPQQSAISPSDINCLCVDIAAKLQRIILRHQQLAAGRAN